MGTGIAAQLASVRDCKRLMLETPYYDFPAVVSRYLPIYPVRWMLHYELPTHQYLQQVEAPVTLFHGTSDGVVAYKNSKRLLPLLKPADELITIEGAAIITCTTTRKWCSSWILCWLYNSTGTTCCDLFFRIFSGMVSRISCFITSMRRCFTRLR